MTSPGRPRDASVTNRVLDATRDLLATASVTDLRIDDVARRSGVAKTTIYRRWPSLTSLIVAAMAEMVGERGVTPTDDPEADLRRFVLIGLRSLQQAGPSLPSLALAVHRSEDPELRREYRERLIDPLREALADCIHRGQGLGMFRREVDPHLVADALLGAGMYRLTILYETPSEDDADALVSTVLEGVRSRRGRGTRAEVLDRIAARESVQGVDAVAEVRQAREERW